VRWALVEAAASVIRQPGPMHAYYQRLRARRGHQIAVVAVARKLAVLSWCLLTRHEQYAHQQPSLTAKKMRLLEIRAGAPTRKGQRTGTFATREKMRQAEKALALQAEASLRALGPRLAGSRTEEGGRERDTGARITQALKGQVARQAQPHTARALTRHRPAPAQQPNTPQRRRPPDERRRAQIPTRHAPTRSRPAPAPPPQRDQDAQPPLLRPTPTSERSRPTP
jgi:hypothetical protein